jgi:predicted PhzF superfamily epimerase YddE/YHI9
VALLHVLRVFANEDGEFGNTLGVFLDGADAPDDRRQEIAAELEFAETVFVDDRERAEMRIFTPAVELAFAGHPSVGTAWLLRHTGSPVEALRPPAGELRVRYDGAATFISAEPAWSPPFEFVQLEDPPKVRALRGPPADGDEVYAWAWIDEDAGTVRARSFAQAYGIPEDEATGSAALALSGRLGRPLTVHQGRGSVIVARPLEGGRVEVGGLVVLDEEREFAF